MSGTHSLLSPSAAARWSRCVGSVSACRDVPNLPNVYSAEGSAYHTVSERALRDGFDADHCIGLPITVDGFSFTIDAENAEYAQTYVDAIRRLPGQKLYEVQLDTSEILGVPGQGGTGDCVTLDYEHSRLSVDDLKFGRGEIVYAKGNEQLLLYAAAALRQFYSLCEWTHVRVAIHQPRVEHYDEHTYTRAEVEQLVAGIASAAQTAYKLYQWNDAHQTRLHLMPGEKQCRWCPFRAKCPARSEQIMQLFPVVPTEPGVSAPDGIGMSDEQIAASLDKVNHIETWCSDMRAEGLRRALAGKLIAGWKIVVGRKGQRKWDENQEKAVESALALSLGDAAYKPREIISPAQADPLLKRKHRAQWDALQPAITQADGKPVLEREIDKRPALVVSNVEFGLAPVDDIASLV